MTIQHSSLESQALAELDITYLTILKLIGTSKEGATVKQIVDELNLSVSAVRWRLNRLYDQGLLRRGKPKKGQTRGAFSNSYFLSDRVTLENIEAAINHNSPEVTSVPGASQVEFDFNVDSVRVQNETSLEQETKQSIANTEDNLKQRDAGLSKQSILTLSLKPGLRDLEKSFDKVVSSLSCPG